MTETTQQEISEQNKKSAFECLIGMFTNPKEIFLSQDEKPRLVTALLITIIATLLVTIAVTTQTIRNPEFLKKFAQMGQQATTVMKYGAPVIGGIFGIIGALIGLFIQAGIIHVIAPFLDGKSSFKKLVTVLGFSNAPYLIFGIISVIYVVLNPEIYTPLTASVSLLVTQKQVGTILYVIATHLDIFVFWCMFLSILGTSVIYKFDWKKSAAIILSIWLVFVGIHVGLAKVFEPLAKQQQSQTEQETE